MKIRNKKRTLKGGMYRSRSVAEDEAQAKAEDDTLKSDILFQANLLSTADDNFEDKVAQEINDKSIFSAIKQFRKTYESSLKLNIPIQDKPNNTFLNCDADLNYMIKCEEIRIKNIKEIVNAFSKKNIVTYRDFIIVTECILNDIIVDKIDKIFDVYKDKLHMIIGNAGVGFNQIFIQIGDYDYLFNLIKQYFINKKAPVNLFYLINILIISHSIHYDYNDSTSKRSIIVEKEVIEQYFIDDTNVPKRIKGVTINKDMM